MRDLTTPISWLQSQAFESPMLITALPAQLSQCVARRPDNETLSGIKGAVATLEGSVERVLPRALLLSRCCGLTRCVVCNCLVLILFVEVHAVGSEGCGRLGPVLRILLCVP